ncbi:MAG: hypothetical protein IPP88_25280 [Betaproteobacteria bacterium]|nr:hypothetical protein [Betaproteobacteria bacterium]
MPNRELAPNLVKAGIQSELVPALDLAFLYFNMKDPIVGGYAPDKIALRRAISLAYRSQDEINIVQKGLALPAHTPYSPGVAGYDPNFRTSASEYNPAKARALLDMHGYLDRDRDGYPRNAGRLVRWCSKAIRRRPKKTAPSMNCGGVRWTRSASGSSFAKPNGRTCSRNRTPAS